MKFIKALIDYLLSFDLVYVSLFFLVTTFTALLFAVDIAHKRK